MKTSIPLAVIGGSGLYDLPGLDNPHQIETSTPFGKPSSPIIVGSLNGKPIAFLARHGVGHTISPSEVNYRANIYALKQIGAQNIISISACGSLREEIDPGEIVIPNNLFDFTRGRIRSFFGEGAVAHISVADPFCMQLGTQLSSAIPPSAKNKIHLGGTLITIEGPRFSTKAESKLFRSWGMDIIGMTTSPEAFLAREAGICYAVMAHVTDYDVWHTSASPVTVDMVIRVLHDNTSTAKETISTLSSNLIDAPNCTCRSALSDALITNPALIPPETHNKLDLLLA